jgi:hypothetical protein
MKEAMMKGKGDAKNAAKNAAMQKANAAKAAGLAGAAGAIAQATCCFEAMSIPAFDMPGMGSKADEIMISGFELSCAHSVTGLNQKVMVPPGSTMKIEQNQVLTVTGKPLMVNFGSCKFPDPTKPMPCVATILSTGGSKKSKGMKFPIATVKTTQFKCGKGQTQTAINSGQKPGAKPVTIS